METKISTSDGRFIDLAKETAQPVSLISSSTSLSVIASDLNPKVTLTKADDSIPIPAGRIVDDSARGSLFWEILDEKSELISDNTGTMESKPHFIPSERNWSTPFRIKWLSPSGKTLPFYKTRHLQNSFNNNRPVKVARDGTEIDPNVGQQLIALFHSG